MSDSALLKTLSSPGTATLSEHRMPANLCGREERYLVQLEGVRDEGAEVSCSRGRTIRPWAGEVRRTELKATHLWVSCYCAHRSRHRVACQLTPLISRMNGAGGVSCTAESQVHPMVKEPVSRVKPSTPFVTAFRWLIHGRGGVVHRWLEGQRLQHAEGPAAAPTGPRRWSAKQCHGCRLSGRLRRGTGRHHQRGSF